MKSIKRHLKELEYLDTCTSQQSKWAQNTKEVLS